MAQSDSGAARSRRATQPRSIADPIREQLETVERSSGEAVRFVREQLHQRPYATLGAGFAAGFVLGGGLTLRLTGMLVAVAGRVAMATMVSSAARGLKIPTERTT